MQTTSAVSALGLSRTDLAQKAAKPVSVNDRIHVACIGFGIMGQNDVRTVSSLQSAELVAVADVYEGRLSCEGRGSGVAAQALTADEWQIRNWYNFVWLLGDSIVEQAVHNMDKIAWAMHDAPPESCVATGGRAVPAEGGNIYDDFAVNDLWADGGRAFLANRQSEGCYNDNSDYLLGTDGVCTIGRGNVPRMEGKMNWNGKLEMPPRALPDVTKFV
jgi:hypothetical protein